MMLCSIIRFPKSEDSGSFTYIFSGTAIFKFESNDSMINNFNCKYNSNTIIFENKAIIFIDIQSINTMITSKRLRNYLNLNE
ncbi:hypothetical protein GCM10023311_04540 [Flaviramulus aquimarinus]|uniref:Uncharacterized protein n=1 Tax=Flaviramulus aquimarinus TaxID=1170456 RepID=A0ABP9EST2_9FLAO